jgi:hypothetical protein
MAIRPGQAKGPNVSQGVGGAVHFTSIILGSDPPADGDWKIYVENGHLKFAKWDAYNYSVAQWVEAGGATVNYYT